MHSTEGNLELHIAGKAANASRVYVTLAVLIIMTAMEAAVVPGLPYTGAMKKGKLRCLSLTLF